MSRIRGIQPHNAKRLARLNLPAGLGWMATLGARNRDFPAMDRIGLRARSVQAEVPEGRASPCEFPPGIQQARA